MYAIVYAHKGIGIDKQLSGGVRVVAPAGNLWEGNLTGDQVGQVEATLQAQEAHERLGHTMFGGRVVCEERDQAPPKGSKKWLRLAAEGKLDVSPAEAAAARAALGMDAEGEVAPVDPEGDPPRGSKKWLALVAAGKIKPAPPASRATPPATPPSPAAPTDASTEDATPEPPPATPPAPRGGRKGRGGEA